MGRSRLQNSGINPIEEESPDSPDASASSGPSRASLACVINAEVAAVLAVMRRNVRWGGAGSGAARYLPSAADDHLDHPLVQSLKSLRGQLFSRDPAHFLDPAAYLRPFLDVVRSDETGAPITGVALSAVYKILTLDGALRPGDGDAIRGVVDAVTSCRFEVTDPASEEAVLMKILQVLLAAMRSPVAISLSNQHVCTVVNTCFRVVHQAGTKGELLQRVSRHTMHELVRCIFSLLPYVAESTDQPALLNGEVILFFFF